MSTNVLLVGMEYTGPFRPGVFIETRGLCYPTAFQPKAAAPLYDYDVIIIYPKSYSHFIFGHETVHSQSRTELWDLKRDDNRQDLDNAFEWQRRNEELEAALQRGTRVIWIAAPNKVISFFRDRSVYLGYVSKTAEKVLTASTLSLKRSKQLTITPQAREFTPYFEQLHHDGWELCWRPWSIPETELTTLATTPEGHSLGVQISTSSGISWMLTPPTSQEAVNILVDCALELGEKEVRNSRFHGIFLSHSHEDRPFVQRLAESLHDRGAERVWVDEAEIMIGDSLIRKIEAGIQQSEYFGVVLSPNSVNSPWVQRELDQAMNMEIQSKTVKVLPILYQPCQLPGFLQGKLYADFTSESEYEVSLQKLLRRLDRKL